MITDSKKQFSEMDAEEQFYIGTMTIVDKYIWCNYSDSVITIAEGWDLMIPMADETLYGYDENHCEMETHCFNFNCKYNHDQNISYHRKVLEDMEWDEKKIRNVQKSFKVVTDTYKNDEEVMKAIKNGNLVRSGYEFTNE